MSPARRRRRARPSATRSWRWAGRAATSWRSTARWATPRTRRSSPRRFRSDSSSVHRRAADDRDRGRPPGPRLEAVRLDLRRVPVRAPTTSCVWRPSAARTWRWRVRMPGVSIGEDGPSQMALEDLPPSGRSTARRCSIRATRTQAAALVAADGRPRGHLLHAHDPREDPGPLRARRRRSTIGGSRVVRARPMTTPSPSSAPASPCTRRSRPRTSWPGRGSMRG